MLFFTYVMEAYSNYTGILSKCFKKRECFYRKTKSVAFSWPVAITEIEDEVKEKH